MKLLAVLVAAFAVASADSLVDWSNVKPVTQIEGFWDVHKQAFFSSPAKIARSRNGRIVNGEIAAPHQFPYQVQSSLFLAIGDNKNNSLINPR